MNSQAPRLGVIETGGAGPPIILLHGFGACAATWEPVQMGLGRASLAFDLPGHASSLNYWGFGSATFAAKAVIEELDRRGIEAFHLAGHSMGGAVAALMACRAPHRLLSMTLLSPGGFGADINAALLRDYGRAVSQQQLRACLEVMCAPRTRISDSIVAMLAAQRAVSGQTDALAHVAASILNGEGQGVLDQSRLAALSMPVSMLWGNQDGVMPAGHIWNAPEHFHREVIPNAGHMLVDEVPEQVLELILKTASRAT